MKLEKITRDVLAPVWAREDISTARIAETLGVPRQNLSRHAHRLGLSPRTTHAPTKGRNEDEFRRMWAFGVGTKEMAAYFGYATRVSVSRRAKGLGLPRRSRHPNPPKLSEFLEAELARKMIEASR